MKYVSEYRDQAAAEKYAEKIKQLVSREWTIMEVCGGQTHSILKYGIDQILPEKVSLIHGPGCPVCVTPIELIDQAIEIAGIKDVILCSFGDMLRVPGSTQDLMGIRASGGDVRIVYSPIDAVRIAEQNPTKKVVFFGVGFETTVPVTAAAIIQADHLNLDNFYMLVSHVLVPPAMQAVLSNPECKVQGFLAAGHVCSIMGYIEYEHIARKYSVPIVVTGFEPLDILEGIHMCLKQLEEGRSEVENQYMRSVKRNGNPEAIYMMREVFEVIDRKWRGIGTIPESGLGLRNKYSRFDAADHFGVSGHTVEESGDCISGQVLTGEKRPDECPAFGGKCTPEHPLGALMVSSEGACAAYYRYRLTRSRR